MILTKIPIFAPKPTVLEILSKGCNHARGICDDIEERTGGRLLLGTFQLYWTLWSLKRWGLLRSWRLEVCGRPQTFYELTEDGVAVAVTARYAVWRFYTAEAPVVH